MHRERGRPSEQDRYDTHRQSAVALFAAVLCELETPVNGAQEGNDNGTIRNLDVLNGIQHVHGGMQIEARECVVPWRHDQLAGRFVVTYLGWRWQPPERGRQSLSTSPDKVRYQPDLIMLDTAITKPAALSPTSRAGRGTSLIIILVILHCALLSAESHQA